MCVHEKIIGVLCCEAYLVEVEGHVIHFNHNVTGQSGCAEPAEGDTEKILWKTVLEECSYKHRKREVFF